MAVSSVAEPLAAFALQPLAAPQSPAQQVRGFRSWKDFVRDHFPWLEMRDHSGLPEREFRAQVSGHRFGEAALSTIRAGASEVIRTRALASAADSGFIKLVWQMAGSLQIEQDGRSCLVRPGEVTVCDTTRPYRIRIQEHSHFAVLMLPHGACPGWERISQQICGGRLNDGCTLQAALGALMALAGVPGRAGAEAQETVLRAVQWMLTDSLSRAARELGVDSIRSLRLSRVQQLILDNIADPDLDAEALAAALCMSRRSLYLLFKESRLTPAKMIHHVRLERSLQALREPSQKHRKLIDIAFDLGFGDYATFSRMFKTQYGLAPRDYRQHSLALTS